MGKSGKRLVASANEALSMVKAQAEIARLQAEVERLQDKLSMAEVDAEFFKGEVKLRNKIPAMSDDKARGYEAAWNDAIEAAAQSAISIMNGRVYFSPRARRDDQGFLDAIRALRREKVE